MSFQIKKASIAPPNSPPRGPTSGLTGLIAGMGSGCTEGEVGSMPGRWTPDITDERFSQTFTNPSIIS